MAKRVAPTFCDACAVIAANSSSRSESAKPAFPTLVKTSACCCKVSLVCPIISRSAFFCAVEIIANMLDGAAANALLAASSLLSYQLGGESNVEMLMQHGVTFGGNSWSTKNASQRRLVLIANDACFFPTFGYFMGGGYCASACVSRRCFHLPFSTYQYPTPLPSCMCSGSLQAFIGGVLQKSYNYCATTKKLSKTP